MLAVKQLVFCAFVLRVTAVYCQTKPFIYIDNGLDGTAVDHQMSASEKMEVELEILHLLGLPKRPKRARSSLRMSGSRFLMDIYKRITEEENEENGRTKREIETNDITRTTFRQIEESDMIMTFESTDTRENIFRHKPGSALWFNISQTSSAEDIIEGELRLFKNKTKDKRLVDSDYTIQLWQIVKGGRSAFLKPIFASNTTADHLGWIAFNITSCLRSWMTSINWNHGVYLTVTPLNEPGRYLKLEDVGLAIARQPEETQPFMAAFMKATNQMKLRKKREAKTKADSSFMDLVKGAYKNEESVEGWRSCRLHHLYISFKDLMWQDWIIAPEGYSSYYCAGECNFPLHGQLNATNHAIVQTLVHLIHPRRFPKPCCSPTTLKPVSILYSLDDVNVILKKYKKMMVKSCGCN